MAAISQTRRSRETRFFLRLAGLLAALPLSLPAQRVVVTPIEAEAIQGAVWTVTTTRNGTLLAGSNELGVFDGDRWQKIDAPGTSVFRALAVSPDESRVYVGATDAVGYVSAGNDGHWTYVSLLPALRLVDKDDLGDVWSVFALEQGALWITDDRVLRSTRDGAHSMRFEVFKLPAEPRLSAFRDGDSVLVYQSKVGLWRIGGIGEPQLTIKETDLPGKDVTWWIQGAGTPGKPVQLVGVGDAAYRRQGTGPWVKLPDLSAALAGTVPTGAAMLAPAKSPEGGERLAVSTLKGGIIVANLTGAVLERINSRSGLPDDSVNALGTNGDRLWAALGSGLVRIDGIGTTKLYARETDLAKGTPIKVVSHNGETYALTSKALFLVPDEGLTPLLQAEARLWDVAVIGSNLWVGGFGGAWRLLRTEQRMEREHAVSADVFGLARVPRVPDGVLALENYTPTLLARSPYGWAAKETGINLKDVPVSWMETTQADEPQLWIATMRGSIYQNRWLNLAESEAEAVPRSRRLTTVRAFSTGQGLPAKAEHPRLVGLSGEVLAFTDSDVLRLEVLKGAFLPAPEMAGFRALAASEEVAGTAYWIMEPRELIGNGVPTLWKVTTDGTGKLMRQPLDVPGLPAIGAVSALNAIGENELWISGSRGFLRVKVSELDAPTKVPAVPLLTRVIDDAGMESTLEGTGQSLGSRIRRVEFRFAAPATAYGGTYFYQTRMDAIENQWSPPSRSHVRQFDGLPPGRYEFRVRLLDRFGRTGPEVARAFVLEAPWYRSALAYVGYGTLSILAVAGGVRWRLARLRKANENLNRLVSERTKELELSNTAKSEFLESISHELRNPLNGMMGMIAQFEEDRLGDQDRSLLRTLKACSAQMAQAFEDVLGFSKIEYGYVKVERVPFRLQQTLRNVVTLLGPLAQQRGNILEVVWPPDLADGFVGDPGKIKTVIGNFVTNALRYAPGTPVKILVEAQPAGDGKGARKGVGNMVNLLIEVRDGGPGIPLEEQELIFRKFVRGSRAKEVAGTGLGLATCHVLAKLMNGYVGVESKPGAGATFYLRILVARADSLPPAPAPAETTGPAGLRALIVEDEAYNQAVLQGIALKLGFSVDVAADAASAMTRFQASHPQVVFLDWELPGAKGDDIARLIRSEGNARQPLILATTAHDSDEIRQKCREAGMDGFLLKPFNLARIEAALVEAGFRWGAAGSPAFADTKKEGLDLEAFENYSRAKPGQDGAAAGLYCDAVEAEVARLQAALAAGQLPRAGSCAHRLKSLGGLINATALNQAAARLEQLIAKGTETERTEQVRILVAASEALRRELASAE